MHLPPGIQILEASEEASVSVARVLVATGGPCFNGHFEGDPILPGIAQIGTVLGVLERVTGPRELRGLRSLRLKRLVRPGDVLEVRVERPGAEGISTFEVKAGGQNVAAGSLVTTPGEP